jgi:CheY-like chemotaxis protein
MRPIKRVLIVEDDPCDVELMINALGENNLADYVFITHDGEEALNFLYHRDKYASLPQGDPQFILLDLKMPKVDGFTVLKQLKSDNQLKSVPVIILTSSQEPGDVDKCYKLGANAYVVKPVQYKDFLKVIRILCEFWIFINKASPNVFKDYANGCT